MCGGPKIFCSGCACRHLVSKNFAFLEKKVRGLGNHDLLVYVIEDSKVLSLIFKDTFSNVLPVLAISFLRLAGGGLVEI